MVDTRSVRPPSVVWLVTSITVLFVTVPVTAFLARVPWGTAGRIVTESSVTTPLRVSLVTTGWATLASLVLGTAVGITMSTETPRRAAVLRGILLIPVAMPPVVAGLMLLVAFGRNAPLGRALGALGWALPFSPLGVIVAQVFVSFPFVAMAVERSASDQGLETGEVAAVAGLGPLARFGRVTLPSVRGALVVGGTLAWARAFGEFGATLTLAGSFPGRTQTLPQAVYLAVGDDRDAALVGGFVMMACAVLIAGAGSMIARRSFALSPAPRALRRRSG